MHANDGYYHLYDVDDHPPRWVIHDSNNISIRAGSTSVTPKQ